MADRAFQLKMAKLSARHRFLLFRNGEGVLHQVVAEEESLWPGMIIVGADGHVATAGAFGALAFSVNPKDFVTAVCNGSYILTVPKQIVITLTGRLSPPAMARDLAMHIINRYAPVIQGKAVLLTGSAIDLLTVSEKMALCNFLPEGGVATALVLPQGEQLAHDITIDTHSITPLVCLPGNRLNFTPPANLVEERISVAIVGGCSSGRLDDIKVLAEVLAKNDVHPEVTCLVTPASRNVLAAMDTLKLSVLLRKAGAIVLRAGLWPLPGETFWPPQRAGYRNHHHDPWQPGAHRGKGSTNLPRLTLDGGLVGRQRQNSNRTGLPLKKQFLRKRRDLLLTFYNCLVTRSIEL